MLLLLFVNGIIIIIMSLMFDRYIKMLRSLLLNLPRQFTKCSNRYIFPVNVSYRNSSSNGCQEEYSEVLKKLYNYKDKVYPPQTFTKVEVRWGDQDAMNHVNNIQYFRYFEQARVNWFFHSANIPLSAVESEVGGVSTLPILARTECTYKRPVTFPDTLMIGFSSQAINSERGDFKHHYVVYSKAQQQVVSTGEADLVAYDYKDKKRQPVPDDWVF